MNALQSAMSHATVWKLGWVLVHSLWQLAGVGVALAILLVLLRKASANARYLVSCAALALMVALPVVTLCILDAPGAGATPAGELGTPASPPPPVEVVPVDVTPAEVVGTAAPVVTAEMPDVSWSALALDRLETSLPYLVLAWLAGVFGLSLWHLGGWAQLQRLKRRMVAPVARELRARMDVLERRLGIGRAVTVVQSALVQVPTVIGWLKPMVLLPASALTGLSTAQLEALLAHELAHVRRHDYLVNMLQTAIEILGFYHPAVWWVSRRIRGERENCCDDMAACVTGDRILYADALTTMEELRGRPSLALAASGGNLLARIRRLCRGEGEGTSRTAWLPSLLALGTLAALLLAGRGMLADAVAEEKGAEASTASEADNPLGLEASVLRKLFITGKTLREAAVECERFRDKHGRWPTSTEQLHEGEPSEPRRDPFHDGPYHLTIHDDGASAVRIWSVGPDGDWDGGRPIDSAQAGLDGDIAIEVSAATELRWLADEAMQFYLEGRRLAHYLASLQPPAAPPTFPEEDAKYAWGDVVNGLQAALEFVPERDSYPLGEALEIQFRIRNAGRRTLKIAGDTWRQGDALTVTDANGKSVTVRSCWYSGWSESKRETLKPGQTAVFKTSGLAFVAPDDDDRPGHPVGKWVECRPGHYTLQFRLDFPDLGGTELDIPQPEDWQGRLATGKRVVRVSAAKSSEKVYVLEAATVEAPAGTLEVLGMPPDVRPGLPSAGPAAGLGRALLGLDGDKLLSSENAKVSDKTRGAESSIAGGHAKTGTVEPDTAIEDIRVNRGWNVGDLLARVAKQAGLELRTAGGGLLDTRTGKPLECAAPMRFTQARARDVLAWILHAARLSATVSGGVIDVRLSDGERHVPEDLVIRPEAAGNDDFLPAESRTRTVSLQQLGPWDPAQLLEFLCHFARVPRFVIAADVRGGKSREVTIQFSHTPFPEAFEEALTATGCELLVDRDTVFIRRIPEGAVEREDEGNGVQLVIEKDGKVFLKGQPVTAAEIAKLGATEGLAVDTPVLIRAHRETRHSHVMAVLNACREAGFQNIGFQVTSGEEPPSSMQDTTSPKPRDVSNAVSSLSASLEYDLSLTGDCRGHFLEIERIARLSKAEQAGHLERLYSELAPRYMTELVTGIISYFPRNILKHDDTRRFGGTPELWTRQLAEAAGELSPEEVADKLDTGHWLNIAAQLRALQVFDNHGKALEAMIGTDLASRKESRVARAARTVSTLKLHDFADELLALLLANEKGSEAAYQALVFMRDPGVARPLLEEVEKNPDVLVRCAGLLQVPYYRKPAEPILLKLLGSPDKELRYGAIRAVYECRDPRLAAWVARFAGDDEPRFRVAAAYMTRNLPNDAFKTVREQLLPLLGDEDEVVRLEALLSFAHQKDLVTGPIILELLRQDRLDEAVKFKAMQSLSALTGKTFGYDMHNWVPAGKGNREAIRKIEAWLKEAGERERIEDYEQD